MQQRSTNRQQLFGHHLRQGVTIITGLFSAGIVALSITGVALAAGQAYRIYGTNFFVCLDTPCTATAPSTEGNMIIEGALKITSGSPGSGKVLMSDANGVGSWQTVAGTGWTDDGAVVRLTTGTDSVGIGTTTPAAKLDVVGSTRIGTSEISSSGSLDLHRWAAGDHFSYIDFHGDDTNTDYGFRFIRGNTGVNTDTNLSNLGTGGLRVLALDAGSIQLMTSNTARVTILSNGNVGVGTTNPGSLFEGVNGGGLFRYNTGSNPGTSNPGQLAIANPSGAGGAWISFLREGQYGANFGLDTDNSFSTRGYSAGTTGYTPMRYGNAELNSNQPQISFIDGNNGNWYVFSGGGNNFAFTLDTNSDGAYDHVPLNLSTSQVDFNDLECSGCIDQGDMKTSTGGTAGFVAVDVELVDYAFFPRIEWDNCATANGADNLAPRITNTANNTIGGFRVNLGCTNTATSWKVRYRFVAASRDQEIFGWYDPDLGVLQHVWVGEIPLESLGNLPVTPVEPKPNWIPVQATIFDRDLARFGQEIDLNNIFYNYTFTRVVKAQDLSPEDELYKVANDQRQKCLAEARGTTGHDNPETKCFQFMTHPDIYYGKLEPSKTAQRTWQQIAAAEAKKEPQSRLTANADLAENYTGQTDVMPGEIVAIDRAQNNFLVRATASESQQLAGVVSTTPGQVLGEKQEHNIELALVGRVPVHMSQSSLPVQAGDMITVSSEAGKGAKATQAGWVVGKALEAWTPGSGKETVLILLNTSVYDPQLVQKSLEGYQLAQKPDGDGFQITDALNQIIERVLAVKAAVIGKITAGRVTAQKMEIDGADVMEDIAQIEANISSVNNEAQQIGSAVLPEGETQFFVNDSRITAETKIFVTPTQTTAYNLAVTTIHAGQGFEVAVPQAGEAVAFTYWIVK